MNSSINGRFRCEESLGGKTMAQSRRKINGWLMRLYSTGGCHETALYSASDENSEPRSFEAVRLRRPLSGVAGDLKWRREYFHKAVWGNRRQGNKWFRG